MQNYVSKKITFTVII